MLDTEDTSKRIAEIEESMLQSDFWNNPQVAQAMIKELQELKDTSEGKVKYARNDAVFYCSWGWRR